MRKCGAALAALGAVAGTGYASGQALVSFFAQTGAASWAGIAVAAAVFGVLTGLCARLAVRSGAADFATLCRRSLPRSAARLVGILHGLLMAAVAAVMLVNAARLAALMLPLRHAALWGMGLALALALLINAGGRRAWPWLGLMIVLIGAAYYGGLALDPRPPRLNFRGEVALRLAGNLPAAALLALCYAALNACVAADVIARCSPCARPARLGLCCGAGLGLMLALAEAALLPGGEALLIQKLPFVLLAARWGLFGF